MVALEVPTRIVACYVVPSPGSPTVTELVALLPGLVAGGLPGPVGRVAGQVVERGLVGVAPVARDALRFQAHLDTAPPERRAAFETATELVEIVAVGAAGRPLHEWAARGIALVLAEHLGAPVLDTFYLRDPAQLRPSVADAVAATGAYGWIYVPYSLDARVARITTVGLHRCGLLELQVLDVPPALAAGWCDVVAATASVVMRLWCSRLDRHPELTSVELPEAVTVTSADLARMTGREAGASGSAEVRLELVETFGSPWLGIAPPAGWPASPGEWMASVLRTLTGDDGGDSLVVTTSRDDPRIGQARSRAKAGLPGVRRRFLEDRLPSGSSLLVQFPVVDRGLTTNCWAAVTGWGRFDEVRGICDSEHGEGSPIRAGRPISVPASEVVDWVVLGGDGAVLEGYFARDVIEGHLRAAGRAG